MYVCFVMQTNMKNKGTEKFTGLLFQLVRKYLPDVVTFQYRHRLSERVRQDNISGKNNSDQGRSLLCMFVELQRSDAAGALGQESEK